MIQRALLRQSRSLNTSLRPLSQSPNLRPQFSPNRLRLAPLSRPAVATRWYASEPEKPNGDESSTVTSEAPTKSETAADALNEASVDDKLAKELEAKSKEIIDLKDKYLRGVADFRNLQERTKRDMQSARDFAIQKFAKDLVESVDNLDRALGTIPAEKIKTLEIEAEEGPSKDLLNLYNGLSMTETILMSTLKKHGLERFDPSTEGEKFNPNEHEAMFMTPMEGKEDNTVFHTQQKGFKLNGRILRAAKVGVVKNPSS